MVKWHKSAHTCSLTGGEATSKEHVEEVLGSDVSLEAPVEVKASSVGVTGAAWLLSSCQVILPSFVWIAQHCVSITNLWKEESVQNQREEKAMDTNIFIIFTLKTQYWDTQCWHFMKYFYIAYKLHVKRLRIESKLLLKASVAPGAWFLSGWNLSASFL